MEEKHSERPKAKVVPGKRAQCLVAATLQEASSKEGTPHFSTLKAIYEGHIALWGGAKSRASFQHHGRLTDQVGRRERRQAQLIPRPQAQSTQGQPTQGFTEKADVNLPPCWLGRRPNFSRVPTLCSVHTKGRLWHEWPFLSLFLQGRRYQSLTSARAACCPRGMSQTI